MLRHRIKYWLKSKYLCKKGTHRLVEMYSHINNKSIGHMCVACCAKILNENADVRAINKERAKVGLGPWNNVEASE